LEMDGNSTGFPILVENLTHSHQFLVEVCFWPHWYGLLLHAVVWGHIFKSQMPTVDVLMTQSLQSRG
jgi:hypothetical protein